MSACADCLGGQVLIDRRLRYVLVFHQFLGALQLQIGVHLRRLDLGEIGRLLVYGRFIDVRLDAKQQIARLDHLPFGEIALPDVAGHARHDVDLVDRDDAADEVAGLRHLAARHRTYGHCRRRRGALRRGGAAAENDNKRADSGARAQSVHWPRSTLGTLHWRKCAPIFPACRALDIGPRSTKTRNRHAGFTPCEPPQLSG